MPRTAEAILLGYVLVLGSRLAFAQAAGPPAFEVAAIEPSDPAETMAIHRSGNRLATSATSLEFLITWAYDVHSDRLFGKPKWLDSVRYDIVANAPEGTQTAPRTPGQPTLLQQMMQTLLTDRFKLALHRETRELPAYALVVAKGGLKVHLAEVPDAMGQNPFSMPGRGRLLGTQVSPAMLAKALASQLDRSVEDETGLKGVFDFTLEWEPDTQSTGVDDEAPSANVGSGPSLFTALREQIGLKLEPRKAPVEVFVIDRIESTPTAN